MKYIYTLLLGLSLITTIAQPKNKGTISKDCDQYVFNPDQIKFDTKYLHLQFRIDSISMASLDDTLYYYHPSYNQSLPIHFEEPFTVSLKRSLDQTFGNNYGHIPIRMKQFNIKSLWNIL